MEHDTGVKHAFPCAPSTAFPPAVHSILLSLPLSHSPPSLTLFFYHFPSLSPSHLPSNSVSFPHLFRKTGFAASSAGRILFRCQMKIPGKSAILSRRSNKSGTLRVIWRRMTQIPLALEQTRGLQLKGRYVAGVPGLFRFISHICGLQLSLIPILPCHIFNVYFCEDFLSPQKTR